MDFNSLFFSYWAVASDVVLISAGLIFVLRLYIVELRLERGLSGYYWFGAAAEAGTPGYEMHLDDSWFLAEQPERHAHSFAYKRLRRLGKVVQLLSVLIIAVTIFLATGLVSAATSTGNLAVSVVVLSRCIVQYVGTPLRASSVCSDSTAPTYTVTPPVPGNTRNQNAVSTVSSDAQAGTVTLTY
jgi:hypothetical protein